MKAALVAAVVLLTACDNEPTMTIQLGTSTFASSDNIIVEVTEHGRTRRFERVDFVPTLSLGSHHVGPFNVGDGGAATLRLILLQGADTAAAGTVTVPLAEDRIDVFLFRVADPRPFCMPCQSAAVSIREPFRRVPDEAIWVIW